ncbi:hypothetical protein EVAR_101354_1 [Eumeta japonica]|uniref:Uncharacterized protein n=1 Tax=Eumeta variegata TaxID=151549 RepID=A0A4C1TIU5_EUMVA|nr:hypothetical protein EVAR_101354_1 [Eumeta japonica]
MARQANEWALHVPSSNNAKELLRRELTLRMEISKLSVDYLFNIKITFPGLFILSEFKQKCSEATCLISRYLWQRLFLKKELRNY